MSPPKIRHHCRLQGEAEQLLKLAMKQMGLSARTHDRILRPARTIADVSGQVDDLLIGTDADDWLGGAMVDYEEPVVGIAVTATTTAEALTPVQDWQQNMRRSLHIVVDPLCCNKRFCTEGTFASVGVSSVDGEMTCLDLHTELMTGSNRRGTVADVDGQSIRLIWPQRFPICQRFAS